MCYCVRRGRPRSESLARSGRTRPPSAVPGTGRCRPWAHVRSRAGASRPSRVGPGRSIEVRRHRGPREEFEETCFPWEPLPSPGNGPGCTSRALGGHPRHPVFPTVLRCSQEPGPFHSASSLCHRPVSLCTVGTGSTPLPGLGSCSTFPQRCAGPPPAGAGEIGRTRDLESNPI